MGTFGREAIVVYSFFMLVFGILGYVRGHSLPSLISGVAISALLGVAYALSRNNLKAGLGLGLLLAVLSAGRFVPAYLRTHHLYPAGIIGGVSVLMAIVLLVALLNSKGA